MAAARSTQWTSFLGTGWSFPPEFVKQGAGGDVGSVVMSAEEEDIQASLAILLSTAQGERLFYPKYGLDLRDQIFESLSTTAETYLKDRVRDGILIYEPRIEILALEFESDRRYEGIVQLRLEYRVRTTNSRYNLVFPFYQSGDAVELGASSAAPAA